MATEGGTILVPLDGSTLAEEAIPYASAVAGSGGQLHFVQVTPAPEPILGAFGQATPTQADVESAYLEAARQELRQTAERWQEVAPRVEVEVVKGDTAEEILRVAADRRCEMIALATRGRGALGRWAFGSIADRVARTSFIPVLLVRPKERQPEIRLPNLRRLVIPYDGSEVAAEAFPVVRRLAARTGLPVHLIRAINPAALVVPYSAMGTVRPPGLMVSLNQQMQEQAEASLNSAVHQLAGSTVTTSVLVGDAAGAIDDSTTEGDLVVMTSHGHSGVRRWLLGSVAEKLVHGGSAPVLLVPASTRRA